MLINSVTPNLNRQVNFNGMKNNDAVGPKSGWKNKVAAGAMAVNSLVPNPVIIGTTVAAGAAATSCETYDLELFGPIEEKHYDSFDDFLDKLNLRDANKEDIDQAIDLIGKFNGIEINGKMYELITAKDSSINIVKDDIFTSNYLIIATTDKPVDEEGNPIKISTSTRESIMKGSASSIIIANGFNSIDVKNGDNNVVIANNIKSEINLSDQDDELHYTASVPEEQMPKPLINLGNGNNIAYIQHADVLGVLGGNNKDFVSIYDGDAKFVNLLGGNDTLKLGGYADVERADLGTGENTVIIPENGNYNIDELQGDNITEITE